VSLWSAIDEAYARHRPLSGAAQRTRPTLPHPLQAAIPTEYDRSEYGGLPVNRDYCIRCKIEAGLWASCERSGSAVIVYTGGEVDAANEHTWRRLLGEAASAVAAPGPLVIDTDGLDFMGCCAFTALAEEADRCRRRGLDLRPVSGKPITASSPPAD
jgi:anti-anti-sigma factor